MDEEISEEEEEEINDEDMEDLNMDDLDMDEFLEEDFWYFHSFVYFQSSFDFKFLIKWIVVLNFIIYFLSISLISKH